jgi:hypothetical protein
LQLRTAKTTDSKVIKELYDLGDFDLDHSHLEKIYVVEDPEGIVAIGSFVTLLEGSFVVNPNRSRKDRLRALIVLLKQGETECYNIGFKKYYVLASNDSIARILKRKFGFVQSKAKQLLLKWKEDVSGESR